MLEVENICKFFAGRPVLKNISFSVPSGCVAALLGKNGAGKTTLLRIICGFFEADDGRVRLGKFDLVDNRGDFLQNIGYVQEISSLYGSMTVWEYLNLVADIRGFSATEKVSRIRKVCSSLSLQDVILQKNETLSKGFKKRAELAAALLAEPFLLVLDEPTEGLDPQQKTVLHKIIREYAQKHIVIISTHLLEDVEVLADRVLLLSEGRLAADCSLQDFKKAAENNLLQSFLLSTESRGKK